MVGGTDGVSEDRSQWATGRLLSTAARLTEQTWNARLRASDVSHAGLIVLHMLSQSPASQRELAGSQYLTEQTIGRTLAHLESTGHIARATDPTDRRRRVVEIAPAGRVLLIEMSGAGDQLTDRILAEAGVEPGSFRAGLQALIDAADAPEASDSFENAPEAGRGDV
ncbi:DNA-binding MarR family transcriptional regulator [Nakamurella sp. UYEF19]|uniref:MarR family winged helix-turn-helix transcriptional regulator n=1 Tax=Nakamurella sp. UYEF19 TaxID=1756392 RepID=UPI0033939AD7